MLEVYDLLTKSYLKNGSTHTSIYCLYETPYFGIIYGHLTIITDNCCNEAIEILNDTSSLENIKLKYYFQELYNNSNCNSNVLNLLKKLGFKEQ